MHTPSTLLPAEDCTGQVGVPMLLGTVSGVIDRNDGTPRALIAMNVTNPCDEYCWDVDGSRMPAGYYNRCCTPAAVLCPALVPAALTADPLLSCVLPSALFVVSFHNSYPQMF